jgi:hypothetical protein
MRAFLAAGCVSLVVGCAATQPLDGPGVDDDAASERTGTTSWQPCGLDGIDADQVEPMSLKDLDAGAITRAGVCEYENRTGGGGCCAGPDELTREVELDAETTGALLRLIQQTRPAAPNSTCMMIDSPIPLHYVVLVDDGSKVRYIDVADAACLGYEIDGVRHDSGQLPQLLSAALDTHGQPDPGPVNPCADTQVALRQDGSVTQLFPAAQGGEVLRLFDKPRAPLTISGACSSLIRVSIFEGVGDPPGTQLPTHTQLRMPAGLYTITVDIPTCAYSRTTVCQGHLTSTRQVVRIVSRPTAGA